MNTPLSNREIIIECSANRGGVLSQKQFINNTMNFFSFIGDIDPANVRKPSVSHVAKYKEYLTQTKKLTTNTLIKYLVNIKTLFAYMEEQNYYPNPLKFMKLPKRETSETSRRALTAEQAIRLINSVNTNTLKGKRNKAIIVLMLTCGLRTIEVKRLNIEHLTDTTIRIRRKGHINLATIPISSEAFDCINDYLIELTTLPSYQLTNSQPLFVSLSRNNKSKRLASVGNEVKKELISASLYQRGLTAHSLRHSFAHIAAAQSNININDLRQILGHQSLDYTQIYLDSITNETKPNPIPNIISTILHAEQTKKQQTRYNKPNKTITKPLTNTTMVQGYNDY